MSAYSTALNPSKDMFKYSSDSAPTKAGHLFGQQIVLRRLFVMHQRSGFTIQRSARFNTMLCSPSPCSPWPHKWVVPGINGGMMRLGRVKPIPILSLILLAGTQPVRMERPGRPVYSINRLLPLYYLWSKCGVALLKPGVTGVAGC